MNTSVTVHGNKKNIEGIIIGFNPESSGFIYEGEFQEKDLDNLGCTLVLEIATNITFDDLVYFPTYEDKITLNTEKSDSKVPIVNNPQFVETETIIIQHEVLESSNIKTIKQLEKEAHEYLDSNYPFYLLWKKLRGNKITVSGVSVRDNLIVDSLSIEENDNTSINDTTIIEKVKNEIHTKYASEMNDSNLHSYDVIRIKEDILNISYYVNDVRIGNPMKGIIQLKDNEFQIID